MNDEALRCEILVIGSGPGGSITAATLADRGRDVILLEEGPDLRADSCAPFSRDEILQKYRSGGLNPALGRPNIPFAEGCCVGGGSEINSGLYHRTPPEVLGLWREHYRVDGLDEEAMDPHFEFCEKALSVQLNPGKLPEAGEILRSGANCLGWKSKEVPRWYTYPAAASGTERLAGKRQSMSESFLPAFRKAGGRLFAGVRADKLQRTNGRWTLHAIQRGRPARIEAETVFVCAGAVQTPALLRRSGIRKNIGDSLAMHPTVKVAAVFDHEVNGLDAEVPSYQITQFSPEICLGCSISSEPYLALAMTDYPDGYKRLKPIRKQMAVYYAMIQGPARGTIRNIPFSTAPLVRYRLDRQNLRSLADALRHLCRVLFSAGAKLLYPSISGFTPLQAEEDLGRIPAELSPDTANLMTIHLFSSCPMGEDAQRCAVNSFGRVHGQDHLYVNDASLLCTAPGVNPQGTIMGIARRNTLHFLEGNSEH